MAIETELKYLLSPLAFQKLAKSLATQRISIEHQHNTYYDTASHSLGRRRLAVRSRCKSVGAMRRYGNAWWLRRTAERLHYECRCQGAAQADVFRVKA